MKKRKLLAGTALFLTVLLCACAAGENEKEVQQKDMEENTEVSEKDKEEKEKDYQMKLDAVELLAYRNADGLKLEPGSYISVIGRSAGGGYWAEVKRGAEQAAADINEELGYKGKDEVKVTYSGPASQYSVDEQVNILDEELARYPAALSISSVDAKACGVQFDLAAESGIPVVAFDSGSDYQGLMATVSTDNNATAAEAADKLAEMMNGSGEVAVFVQDSRSKSAQEREKGFTERLQEMYPDISVVEIYHLDQREELAKMILGINEPDNTESAAGENTDEGTAGNAGENSAENAAENAENNVPDSGAEDLGEDAWEDITEEEIIDYIFEKNPNLKGCFATSGDSVKMLIDAVDRLEKENLVIVGYDADKEELEALEAGKISGLMVQNPFGMGYASVIASARAALSMGNEAYINTGSVWVTKDNLDSAEVQGMLY